MPFRFMRSILFFDLPTTGKKEIREYTKFLKFIKKQGFVMLQESVYVKLSLNKKVCDLSIKAIKRNIPSDGIISVLTITEQQFASIVQLLGQISSDIVTSEDKIINL